jgi:ferredoxin
MNRSSGSPGLGSQISNPRVIEGIVFRVTQIPPSTTLEALNRAILSDPQISSDVEDIALDIDRCTLCRSCYNYGQMSLTALIEFVPHPPRVLQQLAPAQVYCVALPDCNDEEVAIDCEFDGLTPMYETPGDSRDVEAE